MTDNGQTSLRQSIEREAERWGVDLVGFGDVERYHGDALAPVEFWPQTSWPWSKTIIVIAVRIFLPVLATTPSVLYKDLYHTTNRVLDDCAFRIAVLLGRRGFKAFSITRDGYLNSQAVNKMPVAAFSHVVAAKYAGLGTIGYHHMLITPQFGPRVRLATVVTDAQFKATPLIANELCVGCRLCEKRCPGQAYSLSADSPLANYDKHACMQSIRGQAANCCGICCLVCPIGEDLSLYKQINEEPVTAAGQRHTQSYGTM